MSQSMVFLPFVLVLAVHASWGAHALRGMRGDHIALRGQDTGATWAYCAGWVLNVESHNIVGWRVTPPDCQAYISNYIEGGQYDINFNIATNAASEFLDTIEPEAGKDAVVFDIDETLLSHRAFFEQFSFGGEPIDVEAFTEYLLTKTAPAFLTALDLYKKLRAKNWVIIFLTARDESFRNVTAQNLVKVGLNSWDELILRGENQHGILAGVFKFEERSRLVREKGYRIRSCIGDQWSDCQGGETGRSFKLPNPMYYNP